ncbi:hypothetical protein SmJEL517_g05115 [Synchytrium microbalum]|uniref:Uncharacterized protein n=1 Tax=Synchytrium microbalum TaxID=1806994 RepID=A0A507BXK4_9FUNG|nr:uncharacterized protein SmJEL517_g05115 [Synchytrium microbalum]TPX31579.1 hypothetical protein SmJEL517_g05115 [Synchytrium microbalum]
MSSPVDSKRDIDAVLGVPPHPSNTTTGQKHSSRNTHRRRRRRRSTSDLHTDRPTSETDIDHLLIQADYAPRAVLATLDHRQLLITTSTPSSAIDANAHKRATVPAAKTLLAVRTLTPAYVINFVNGSEDVDELIHIGDVTLESNPFLHDINQVMAVGDADDKNLNGDGGVRAKRLKRKATILRKSQGRRQRHVLHSTFLTHDMIGEGNEDSNATRIVLLNPSQFPPYLHIPIGRAAEDIDQLVTVGSRWRPHSPRLAKQVKDIDGLLSSGDAAAAHNAASSNNAESSPHQAATTRVKETSQSERNSLDARPKPKSRLRRSTSSPEFPIEWMDVEEYSWTAGVTLSDGPRDVDDVLLIAANDDELQVLFKDGLDVDRIMGLSSDASPGAGSPGNSANPQTRKPHTREASPSPTEATNPPPSPAAPAHASKAAQRVSYVETDGKDVLHRHNTTIRTTPTFAQNEFGLDIDGVLGHGRKSHLHFSAPCLDEDCYDQANEDEIEPRRNSIGAEVVLDASRKVTRFKEPLHIIKRRSGIKRSQSSPTKSVQWQPPKVVHRSRTNLDIELYVSASNNEDSPTTVQMDPQDRPVPDISEILKMGKSTSTSNTTTKKSEEDALAGDAPILRTSSNVSSAASSRRNQINPATTDRASANPSESMSRGASGGLAGASSEGRLLFGPRRSVPSESRTHGHQKEGKQVINQQHRIQTLSNENQYRHYSWRSEPELQSPLELPATDINDMVEWGLRLGNKSEQV